MPVCNDASCRGLPWLGPTPVYRSRRTLLPSADLVSVPGARLNSPRLEKRSQALQACNLTRNIQADGAPMVHRTPGASAFRGLFFASIGHRSHASENAPEKLLTAYLRQRFRLSASAVASSSVNQAIQRRLCTYWGLSRGRSMKIRERSQSGVGFIHSQGLRTWRVHTSQWNSAPLRKRNRRHRDSLAATGAAATTPTHSGWYTLPFFHRPHNVAAKDRATLRRASFADRPAAIHLRYRSANGFSP